MVKLIVLCFLILWKQRIL